MCVVKRGLTVAAKEMICLLVTNSISLHSFLVACVQGLDFTTARKVLVGKGKGRGLSSGVMFM